MTHTRFLYDIHSILSVDSVVRLPELQTFLTNREIDAPTVTISQGEVGAQPDSAINCRTITYRESPGQRGFAIRVTADSDRFQITASALVCRSPHVLYTNAVEPVLRWAFVERGYALVHGACLSSDGNAFLITARTDTGKTTTVLKSLDAHPEYSFLSDDLTLVNDQGTVLSYAKPLTISRHTLHAVHTPLLTARERFTLAFQSRLHSKSGRMFGLLLTKYRIPMATANAIVQWLVPPPKYAIQRLVPHAQVSRSAHLSGMMVIERGISGSRSLTHSDAVDVLIANSEDSYGFPPYDDIKELLYLTPRGDLREEEKRIVSAAMLHAPSVVLRSEGRTWFTHIPSFISGIVASRPSRTPELGLDTAAD